METISPPVVPHTLSATERRVVWTHRASWFLWEGQFGVNKAVRTAKWLLLCNGDAGRFAQCLGQVWSLNSVCNLVLNPIVGALSDAIGRKYLVAATRVGLTVYFMGGLIARNTLQMMAVEVLGFGILSAGGLAVQAASLDDMFASRPELNSTIQAQNSSFAGVSGCLAPLVGIQLFRRQWNTTAYVAPTVALLLQALLFAISPETLAKEDRQPFRVVGANPISNCKLLLNTDKGLRRLTLASMCYHACTSTWSTQEGFRARVRPPADFLTPLQTFHFTTLCAHLFSL